MPAVKSLAAIREKYARVTPGRSGDYQAGVANPRADWAVVTKAADGAYKAGVQAAIARNAFTKGVDAAGTAKWQARSVSVGAERWGPGVLAAVDTYERGVSKYRDAIEKATLPPRYPVGDPRNFDRVKAIGEALRRAKVGAG